MAIVDASSFAYAAPISDDAKIRILNTLIMLTDLPSKADLLKVIVAWIEDIDTPFPNIENCRGSYPDLPVTQLKAVRKVFSGSCGAISKSMDTHTTRK